MCLGVPGKVVAVERSELGLVNGRVDFGGITKEVNLSFTPEAEIGDYVVVHVGFAISTLDEDEAMQVFRYLEEMGALGETAELGSPPPGGRPESDDGETA